MHCITPREVAGGSVIPCGNCRFCRRKAQQVWGTRILLESYFYPHSVFGTLTYSDDNVPMYDGVLQLHKPDITTFLEKLRWQTRHMRPLRFFIVGEYGDETWRPHYHFILFGHDISVEPAIKAAWTNKSKQTMGLHQIAPLNFDRALYTARYCLKKMTREGDEKLQGRMPEFSRMSTKPGLGTPAIGWLADAMGKQFFVEGKPSPLLKIHGDVFTTVRIEGRMMPIGNFLRSKLRQALGLSDDQRERAHQLGRFDSTTGEIFEETILRDFAPAADLADIRSPWRLYAEKEAAKAKAAKADEISKKLDRQATLFRGDRI